MLDEKTLKSIEEYLNHAGELYFHALNDKTQERTRGECQAIGFVLSLFGYGIEWHDEKASIVNDG